MPFPLAKLNSNDLISVLTKMEFSAFRHIRQATPWLTDFIDKKRVKIRLVWLTIRPEGFSHHHMGSASFPEKDLELIRPICILFYESSWLQMLSVDYSKFTCLQLVKFFMVEEYDAMFALDKLYKESIPQSVVLLVRNWKSKRPHDHHNCLFKHPILHKIKDIEIYQLGCPSPDLSFLCADHGTVKMSVTMIPDTSIVIRTIEMISDGAIGTKLLDFTMEKKDIVSIKAVLDGLPWKFIWSKKEHETSCLKDRTVNSFPSGYSFWSIPVAEGKVGGLAAGVQGNRLIFKVFDNDEEFLNGIASGRNFYLYSSYSE